MTRVKFSRTATRDLERVISFLEKENPNAAVDATDKIGDVVNMLEKFPEAGKLIRENPATRIIATGFEKSGYVFRYRIENPETVVILRIWHGKEDR